MLAYGVHDLQEAGILPGLNNLAFDVSATIPPSSWYGTLLKGIFNFSPATTWLQAVAWVRYVVPTLDPLRARWSAAARAPAAPPRPPAPPPAPGQPRRLDRDPCTDVRARRAPLGLRDRRPSRCSSCRCRPPAPPTSRRAPSSAGADRRESTATTATCRPTRRPSGNLDVHRHNDGDEVTEFYLLAEDGLRIVGEVENIGPGLTRDLVVSAAPGQLLHGVQAGHGRRRASGPTSRSPTPARTSAPTGDTADAARSAAEAAVRAPTSRTRPGSSSTEDAGVRRRRTRAGDDDAARDALRRRPRALGAHRARRRVVRRPRPPARPPRGRPRAEGQDVDRLAPHREGPVAAGDRRRLHVPLTPAAARRAAPTSSSPTPSSSSTRSAPRLHLRARSRSRNGAKELLDEVATGKVTGEEEIWSHTDLWDFQANVDGARIAFEVLADVARGEDPELADDPAQRFDALQALLDAARVVEDGFALYDRAHARPGQGAGRRRRRAERAAVAAHHRRQPAPRDRGATPALDATIGDRPTPSPHGAASGAARCRRRGRRLARRRSGSAAGGGAGAGVGARPGPPRADRAPGQRRTRSTGRTRPASSPPRRTGCTSRPSTSRRPRATSWSRCCERWTAVAARLTAGRCPPARSARPAAPTTRRPTTPARRWTCRRPASRITFGFGPLAVRRPRRRPRPVRPRGPAAAGRSSSCRTSRATTSTRRARGGDLSSRPAPTTRRSRCTPIRNLARIAFGTARLRWSQLGFGRTSSTSTAQATPRNLFGFKDGTANVKAEETAERSSEHVWVRRATTGPPAAAWLAGGTLPRRPADPDAHRDLGPHRAARAGGRSSGRTKGEGAPLSGGTEFTEPDFAVAGADGAPLIAVDSHVRLAHPSSNGGVPDAATRLQLHGRQRPARPARRGPVLRGLRARPADAATSRCRTRWRGPTPSPSTSSTRVPGCTRCRPACRPSAPTGRWSTTPTSGRACSPDRTGVIGRGPRPRQPPASPVAWPPFRWCMPWRNGRTSSGSTRASSSRGSFMRLAMSPRSRNVAVSTGENRP